MFARFNTVVRLFGGLWLAVATSVVPVAARDAPVELAAAMPVSDTAASAAPIRAVIVAARAMDLVGTPVSLVPRGGYAKGASGKAGIWSGPISLPGVSPLSSSYITSGFGIRAHPILGGYRLHAGLDLAAPYGSPVYATMDGYVAAAGWAGGYGLSVRLANGGAVETRYGHMSRLTVAAGSFVRKGELIGYVGSTGLSTGPHLHYEVRINGRPVDPRGLMGR